MLARSRSCRAAHLLQAVLATDCLAHLEHWFVLPCAPRLAWLMQLRQIHQQVGRWKKHEKAGGSRWQVVHGESRIYKQPSDREYGLAVSPYKRVVDEYRCICSWACISTCHIDPCTTSNKMPIRSNAMQSPHLISVHFSMSGMCHLLCRTLPIVSQWREVQGCAASPYPPTSEVLEMRPGPEKLEEVALLICCTFSLAV